MTNEDLDRIMEYEHATTDGPWVFGNSPDGDREDMIAYVSDLIAKSPGHSLYLVCQEREGHPDAPAIVAVTGNGKQSEENAKFLTLAKKAIPLLIAEIKALQETSLERLLSCIQVNGSSVDLNWDEETNRWECSFITGGHRYTGFSKEPPLAVRQAIAKVQAAYPESDVWR